MIQLAFSDAFTAEAFLSRVTKAKLASPLGEALLAMAVAAPERTQRTKARGRLAAEAPRLARALKVLANADYTKATSALPSHLEALAKLKGFALGQFAFHVRRLGVFSEHAALLGQTYAGEVPEAYVRIAVEAASRMGTLGCDEPVDMEVLFRVIRKSVGFRGARTLVLHPPTPGPAPDLSEFVGDSLFATNITSLGDAPTSITRLQLTDCNVSSLPRMPKLNAFVQRGGSLDALPPASRVPLLETLELDDVGGISALPSDYSALPLQRLRIRKCALVRGAVPPALLSGDVLLPGMVWTGVYGPGAFTAPSVDGPFGTSPVVALHELLRSPFRKPLEENDLPGPVGEALLAIALAAPDAKECAAARATIKRSKNKRLVAALKALSSRSYSKRAEPLVDDLALLERIEGLNVPQLVLHLAGFVAGAKALPHYRAHLPISHVRNVMKRRGSGTHYDEPLAPETYLALVRELNDFNQVKSLSFNPPSDCVLPDLGDFAGSLTLMHHVRDLGANTLHKVTSLTLIDTQLETLPSMPKLRALCIRGGALTTLPQSLRLASLELSDLRALRELPADLGALGRLTKLEIFRCGLRTLPASLGNAQLASLTLQGMTLESVPTFEGATPAKTRTTDIVVSKPPAESAVAFLGLPASESALKRFDLVLHHVRKAPTFAKLLAAFAQTKNAAASKLPELLLAATRTCIDIEHGVASNAAWAKHLCTLGGPVERAASKRIAPCLRDEAELQNAITQLASLRGFDTVVFGTLVREAWATPHHVENRAEWF